MAITFLDGLTTSGDLTVSGGDIVLGGTGRIQGVDTVSASTDAANKAYVDSAVAGVPVGDITGVTAGTGMTGGGTSGTVTLTNSDRGSSQSIFKNIAVGGQSTVVADNNNDTLTLVAAGGMTITTNASTDTITFNPNDDNSNYYLNGITKSGNTLTFSVLGATNQTYTFGSNAFNSTTIATNNNQLTNGAGYTTNTGDITSVSAGVGLSGGGTSGAVTLALDLGELAVGGTLIATDYLIAENGGVDNRQLISSIPLSIFNNNAGWTSNTGDITGVTAGSGLSGGGTSGTVTLTNSDKGSSQSIFKKIAVGGQSTIYADNNNDTLTLVAGTNITLTTNASTDSVTITASGGSGGGDIENSSTQPIANDEIIVGAGGVIVESTAALKFIRSTANQHRVAISGGGVQVGAMNTTASATLVGSIIYTSETGNSTGKNFSQLSVCMQTGASTFTWQQIELKTW